MSKTASLPPSYSLRTPEAEIAPSLRPPRPVRQGSFVKQSKKGDLTLQLVGQEEGTLPAYGYGALIEGTVNVEKAEGAQMVRLRVKGTLSLVETGGAERAQSSTLCLDEHTLWTRGDQPCPQSLPFSLVLPTSFCDGRDEYPLPPTYEVSLPGFPGFRGQISYSIESTLVKGKTNSIAKALGLGNPTVSTSFLYLPRSRPAAPLPPPLSCYNANHGFADDPRWNSSEIKMVSRIDAAQDITVKMYLPRTRIFCLAEPLPFHVTFSSSALSLATFMPFGPISSGLGKPPTTISLLRQSNCNIGNDGVGDTKTGMWQSQLVGEGTFQRAGDGSDWMSFNGRITVLDGVKIGGFRAGGLFVKDFVVLTMVPPEPHKAPFREIRLAVPIRLTTDPWVNEDAPGYAPSSFSVPSDPEDYVEALPQLSRGF